MHSLAYELQAEDQEPDWAGVFSRLAERFDGAYNIVLLTASGELVVARDPLGFRPLCIAEHGPLFAAASESVPLANLGFRNIRSLEPGTLAVANRDGVRIERFAPSPRQAHCFFEWIYFANVASTLDDRSVYLSRAALGKELARLEDVPLDADTIVVPVPDTAKAAADAMAFALGIPSVEGLMRNRYVGRTFIEGTADRAAKARLKYTPLPEVLAGKRVLLVEDSIVRSTTMRALVHEIRDRGGAREIHLRVACPPIIAPCFYGIDMSRRDELFATPFVDLPDGGVSDAAQQRMAKELGADSLRYLPVEAIARSVSLSPDRLCRACITGRLPHRRPASSSTRSTPTESRHANGSGGLRAYELTHADPAATAGRRRLGEPQPAVAPSPRLTLTGTTSGRRQPVMRPVDRPAFDPVLALEVGQVIEVVLGLLRLGERLLLEPGVRGHQARGSRRSIPRRRWRPGGRRRASSAALDVGDERLGEDPALLVPLLPPGVGEVDVHRPRGWPAGRAGPGTAGHRRHRP